MQEKLVILLYSTPDLDAAVNDAGNILLSWALMVDGHIKQQVAHARADELAAVAKEREVMLMVPAEDVLLASVNVPKMNRSRLAQALPFALEEQLTEEVDALHFAAGHYQDENDLPVAIVSHKKIQQWLALLSSWGIKADRIIPISLALPNAENEWHIVLYQMAVVRTGRFQGFACDRNNLIEFLDFALKSAANMPELIYVHNYSDQTFDYPLNIKDKIRETHETFEQIIFDLATNSANVPSINLLQGPYAIKKSRFAHKGKLWTAVAGLASLWVLLLFLYPTVSYFILHERANKIEADITQIYQRNFPQSSSVVAPKLRMEEKLQKLTAQIGQNRVLLLMGSVGEGMSKALSIKLKRIDFQNNQLTLELTAATSEEFSVFTDFLTHQGLKVKQQNANLTGARINATLLIE